jgi:hypothetical protein
VCECATPRRARGHRDLAQSLTPAAIQVLVAHWSELLASARNTAAAAAALSTALAPYGGVGGLEEAATGAVAAASMGTRVIVAG